MAITNPAAIRFCNERVRVAASHLAQAYFLAKAASAEWTANNMGAFIPVDGGEVRYANYYI